MAVEVASIVAAGACVSAPVGEAAGADVTEGTAVSTAAAEGTAAAAGGVVTDGAGVAVKRTVVAVGGENGVKVTATGGFPGAAWQAGSSNIRQKRQSRYMYFLLMQT